MPLLKPAARCVASPRQEPLDGDRADARIPGTGSVFRTWRIEGLANDAKHNRLLDADSRGGGEIHLVQNLGPMSLNPQGSFPNAYAQLFSNGAGSTYWPSVEAPTSPVGLDAPDSLIGGEAVLRQLWRNRKVAPGGSLRMLITRTLLEGLDSNGQGVDFDESGERRVLDIAGRSDAAHAGALLSDGRIVVTGRAATSGVADPDIAIVRLDAAGTPAPTFGSGGTCSS